jgi:hypothetical protein
MSERDNRLRDYGARLMLETVILRHGYGPYVFDDLWNAYVHRMRAERLEAIRYQIRLVRFSILYRAGRDRDWIRSYTKYGLPPVPDDD